MREGQAPLSFLNLLLASFGLGVFAAGSTMGSEVYAAGIIPLAALGVLLIPIIVWCRKKSSVGAVAICALLFCVLGFIRFALAAEIPESNVFHRIGQSAEITGKVLGEARIQPSIDGRGWRFRYTVEAQNIKNSQGKQEASGHLYVSGTVRQRSELPSAKEGDILRAYGKLKSIRGYKNPGQIDMTRQARSQGITARLTTEKGTVQVIPTEGNSFFRSLSDIRNYYRGVLAEAMPEADASAVFAMLFGGYDGIRAEVLDAFTATGIVHILSVSGSHITLLAAVFAWIGRVMRLRRGITAGIIFAAIVIYVLLADSVAPAVRSGIMGILAAMSLVWEREKDARQILSVTGLLMLMWSPWLLFDISFELSFAATAGLLYIAPVLRKLKAFERIPAWLSGSLAITVSAQLAVLPILARYFHVVSLSSLLANLLVVPVLEIIMVTALFAGIGAALLPLAARFILAADSLLLGAAYEMTRGLAQLPMSQVYLPPVSFGAATVYYMCLCFFLQTGERKNYLKEIIAGRRALVLAVVIFAFMAGEGIMYAFRPNEMSVHFIDVGQGDSALVITPHGRAFMIDTGGSRDASFDIGARVDVPYLLEHGIKHLDAIFLTHAHEDHASGAGGIIKKIPVDTVVAANEGKAVYQASMRLSSSDMDKAVFASWPEGTEMILDGVRVEVLYAPKGEISKKTGNELSNVYRVSYGDASFLFTGDLLKENEKELLRAHDVRSSVLKVGHHGSKTSSSEEFLAAAAPEWAVISVGYENSFGHPSQETMQALERHGIKVYRTDCNGAVVFKTDGKSMQVQAYRNAENAL